MKKMAIILVCAILFVFICIMKAIENALQIENQ